MENADQTLEALAVYGSLAPGEPNHWVLARIEGEWTQAVARGYRFEITWGPAEGYDGFLPDDDGFDVPVWLLQSHQLGKKWREIDDFEGPGYERRQIPVITESGTTVNAHAYVALTDT